MQEVPLEDHGSKKGALRSSPKQNSHTKKALTLKSLTLQPIAIATSIGSQVRNLRHELDLTVAELADQASLSTSMLYKIEKGAVSASIEKF